MNLPIPAKVGFHGWNLPGSSNAFYTSQQLLLSHNIVLMRCIHYTLGYQVPTSKHVIGFALSHLYIYCWWWSLLTKYCLIIVQRDKLLLWLKGLWMVLYGWHAVVSLYNIVLTISLQAWSSVWLLATPSFLDWCASLADGQNKGKLCNMFKMGVKMGQWIYTYLIMNVQICLYRCMELFLLGTSQSLNSVNTQLPARWLGLQ